MKLVFGISRWILFWLEIIEPFGRFKKEEIWVFICPLNCPIRTTPRWPSVVFCSLEDDPLQAEVVLAHPSVEATSKVLLNHAGPAMGFAGIICVGYELSTHWQVLADLSISVYCLTAIVRFICSRKRVAWKRFKKPTNWLSWDTVHTLGSKGVFRLRLAKYIPGNIFQFVGRHGLGLAAGLNNRQLIRSTLVEFTCLISTGASCAIVLLLSYILH